MKTNKDFRKVNEKFVGSEQVRGKQMPDKKTKNAKNSIYQEIEEEEDLNLTGLNVRKSISDYYGDEDEDEDDDEMFDDESYDFEDEDEDDDESYDLGKDRDPFFNDDDEEDEDEADDDDEDEEDDD